MTWKRFQKSFSLATIFQKAQDPLIFTKPPVSKPENLSSRAEFQSLFWQSLYGWRRSDNLSGRFRKAMISSPEERKTILVAGTLLYEFCLIVIQRCRGSCFVPQMIKPKLKIALSGEEAIDGITGRKMRMSEAPQSGQRWKEARTEVDESYIRPLSRDMGLWMVLNQMLVLDEFAASKTNEMIELFWNLVKASWTIH